MKKIIILLLILVLNCKPPNDKIENKQKILYTYFFLENQPKIFSNQLDYYRQTCNLSFFQSFCFVSIDKSNGTRSEIYRGIEGLNYEWGYFYDITYSYEKSKASCQDDCFGTSKLISINSKIPADNKTLTLNLDKNSRNEFSPDYTSFTILGERKMNCNQSLCQQLNTKIQQLEKNKSCKATFKIISSTNDLIELVGFE
ncbi:MAG: hypothetical protein SFU98_13335 [Leptospiraceae bacterium]|nr:hypothetical protein [Leptospiraceae bacterium]